MISFDLKSKWSKVWGQTPINCRFFLKRFSVCFNHFMLLFLVIPCLVVAVHSLVWSESQLKRKRKTEKERQTEKERLRRKKDIQSKTRKKESEKKDCKRKEERKRKKRDMKRQRKKD